MKIFTGYDARESVGWHVFAQSVIETTPGAALIPLPPLQRDGSNAFTYSRFLVPQLCEHKGWALFVDGVDMLARTDLNAIMAHADPRYAALVVKHDYATRHPRKYLGTAMECANEDYPRKNWSSVILWNCSHDANLRVNLERPDPLHHRFPWIPERELGELPARWNWLADEAGENPQADIAHWTAWDAWLRALPQCADGRGVARRAREDRVIHRRELLQRDAPENFPALLAAIRAHGYSTSDIAFILNVPRSTLTSWERPRGLIERASIPNYEDGRAIIKFHEKCRNCDITEGHKAA